MARLIGLTGGIASGKTTVARLLQGRGAVVVDADRLAREVVEPGTDALREIEAEFGTGVLAAGGALDRAALGALVFADPERRRRLEAITHPRIRALMAQRVLAGIQSGAPLVVADIPLLFETGRPEDFQGVLLVYCDGATQLRRLMARDALPEAEARRRLDAQLPIEAKRDRATWVVDNGGDELGTADQVDAWWSAEVGPGYCP